MRGYRTRGNDRQANLRHPERILFRSRSRAGRRREVPSGPFRHVRLFLKMKSNDKSCVIWAYRAEIDGPLRPNRKEPEAASSNASATMTKFLVLYHSTTSVQEQMASATPEQMKAGMDAWMAWDKKAGSAV